MCEEIRQKLTGTDEFHRIRFLEIKEKIELLKNKLDQAVPVALMLIARDATVTVCHTKTVDLPGECRNADIIVACCGVAKTIGPAYLSEGQIVIDVGMNVDEEGKLCGDVDYDKVSEIAEAVTPVPGGVGSITTAILLKHVVVNAERQA